MTHALAAYDGPVYVRMGRGAVPDVYEGDAPFEIGKANTLRNGDRLTIIATGEMVYHAKKAGELLQNEGIAARVLDMHTLKPFDEDAVRKAARETGHIVTVESTA